MDSTIISLLVLLVTVNQRIFASDIVRLDPVCSRNGAGVHWEITSSELGALYRLNLEYSCTTTSGEVINHTEDDCFHKSVNKMIRPIGQLPENERSMFHAVTAELELGTVCVFYSRGVDNFWMPRTVEEDTVNCTVGESPTALPAMCSHFNGTCDCQCGPGMEAHARNNDLDGNICNPTATNISMAVTISLSSTILEGSDPTYSIPERNAIPLSTSTGTIMGPTDPYIESESDSKMEFIAICVLLIGVILLLSFVAVWMHRRNKNRRRHNKMVLPFDQLKLEKIDPDFYPVNEKEVVFVSESIMSIFNILEAEPDISNSETEGTSESILEFNAENHEQHSRANSPTGDSLHSSSYLAVEDGNSTKQSNASIELHLRQLDEPDYVTNLEELGSGDWPKEIEGYILPISSVQFSFPKDM